MTHPANSDPIGSGPFKLEEFKPGEQITLVKNPDFFIPGRPYLDKIVIRINSDPNAILLAVENGEADCYPFVSTSQDIKRLEKVKRLGVTDKGYAAVGPINWLAFNTQGATRQQDGAPGDRLCDRPQFHHQGADAWRRQAAAFADHRVEPVLQPEDSGLRPRSRKGQCAARPGRPQGGRRRHALQADMDYIPGAGEEQQGVAQYLKSQLKKVGIDVEVRASPDFPTWAKRISNYDFDMTMDAVFNWGDPVIGVHRTYLSSNIRKGVIWSNTQQYSNPKVDELLNKAAVELDFAKRKALYDEFQMIVGDDLPIYWINALPYHTAYDKRIGNFPESIWGTMQSMDEVYWTKTAEVRMRAPGLRQRGPAVSWRSAERNGVLAYIARRLVYGVILLVGVLVLNFFLIHAAPGDPAETIAGEMGGATAKMLAQIRAGYGLDKPLLAQLAIYLGHVAMAIWASRIISTSR